MMGALPDLMQFTLPQALFADAVRIASRTTLETSGAELSTLRQAEGLCCETLALASARSDAPASLLPALHDKNLMSVLRAVHAGPAHAWSIQQLAKLSVLSRTAFCRRFTHSLGISPMDYVRQLRIRKSLALLRSTAMGINEVAAAVSYNPNPRSAAPSSPSPAIAPAHAARCSLRYSAE